MIAAVVLVLVLIGTKVASIVQSRNEQKRAEEALNQQQEKLQNIFKHQEQNNQAQEALAMAENLDIFQLEEHRTFGIKLITDAKNQERIIDNTKRILEHKQKEVKEAHQKVEVLKRLKEKQEKEYYQEFLHNEMKEIDDMTSARFKVS